MQMDKRDLWEGPWDDAAAILRSCLGAVPVVGSALNELVNASIPNQRIDRVVRYLQSLTARLEELDRRVNTANPRTVDLFEDTISQSTRALSQERNSYLAALMADNADASPDQYEFSKKLLRTLGELTDRDIEVLKAHAKLETRVALERDWPGGGSMTMAERRTLDPDVKFQWEARSISLDVHRAALERSGLLEREEETWKSKGECTRITTLGRLLLTRIFGEYVD